MAAGTTHGPSVTEASFNRLGFWALIVTQFQGAFNDNVFRFLIVFFLVGLLHAAGDIDGAYDVFGIAIGKEDFVYSFATFIFSMPFIIFAAVFGAISDRFSKQRVAIATKYIEIGIMSLGAAAFLTGQVYLIWFMLFLMGTQSAMFGPSKYGIMPEILPEPRLSWGNGILQMGTIVAVIAGTGLAGPLYGMLGDQIHFAAAVLICFSIIGCATSHFITRPPAANPRQRIPMNPLRPWEGMGRYLRVIWRDRILRFVVVGYVYFWFCGAFIQTNILKFANSTLELSPALTSALLAAVAVGIGSGAVAAGYLSRGRIELGLIPIAAAGMTVFAALISVPAEFYERTIIAWAGPFLTGLPLIGGALEAAAGAGGAYFPMVLLVILGLGGFAGMYNVPLAAAIQERSPNNMKGGVIAATNAMTWVAMAGSAIVYISLATIGFDPYDIFLTTAALTLTIGVFLCYQTPVMLLRMVLWIAASTFCRVKVLGRENLPEKGGALYVANHTSLLDALALIASTDRTVHFLVGGDAFDAKWSRRIARMFPTITVNPHGTPREVDEAMARVREVIAQGHVVCVPSEERFADDGTPMPFHKDYQVLLGGLDAPVAPVHITRMWSVLYDFVGGKPKYKRAKRLPHRIVVNYGAPMPGNTPAVAVRTEIQRLGTDSYEQRPTRFKLLHRGFVHMARKRLRSMAIADVTAGSLSYFKTLVGSIVFARKLNAILDKQPMVGVLVPPTVGATLTNIALQMMGRVPVNLNYTASKEALESAVRQCGITQVLTARQVLERLNISCPAEPVFLDEIRPTVTGKDRVIGMLLALFAPVRLIERIVGSPGGRSENDLATVIFSSGSEGDPKGVMLTQRNIITNVEASLEAFPHGKDDCMIGFLPFFHSFGFTGTLWLTLLSGLRAVFHPNPLEPKVIGELTQKYKGTVLIATSTFLQGFIRRCEAEQLASLRFVVCGAEKLAPRVREAFREKFSVEPLEGYGTTECAPVVSVNIPDAKSPGFFARWTKHGTIGRPVPGISLRVLDPDSGRELGVNAPGVLLVKGPNIMQGYLHLEEKTAEVLQDGWYATGDIAAIDEDGFVTITDRLSRFSKIGGEMVPHTKVEDTLHRILGLTEQSLAIASVPDTQKGERLIVLHTLSDEQLDTLMAKIPESDLPNLWRPRVNNFYRIDEIPVLGTGKMDLKSVKQMASAFDVGE